ncbi:MAG: 5'/3'-nucleotidase SurE [Emcibacter sp.]|nr:5'/3'-nucleotidase SurE [Emcibacter sp.]
MAVISNVFIRFFMAAVGLYILSCPAVAAPYHILITNDDGIDNPGLIALAHSLSKDFHITVSAPAKNMSGNSHATNLFKGPVKVDEKKTERYMSFAVHGTPADAARFGIIRMRNSGTPVDLVISGINPGSNIGALSHLSGTIGAAMEALYYDIPAIALNLDRKAQKANGYGAATNLVKKLIGKIRKNGLPHGVMLNVNIPHNAKGRLIVPMGPNIITVKSFIKTETGYKPDITFATAEKDKRGNDVAAYLNGYTTITPLKIDWTAQDILPQLRSWHLE